MWQDFFYFSRREKQGIILLLVLIGGILLGKYVFSSQLPEPLKESDIIVSTEEADSKKTNSNISIKNDSVISYKQNNAIKPQTIPEKEKRTYYVHEKDTLFRPSKKVYSQSDKLKEGMRIEINTSDTLDLKKIPGIGPAFAKRINTYRNILGGFYCMEQLQEVYGMYEELYEKIVPFIQIDSTKITSIPINSASLEKLKAHPYINFYQAKAIIQIRKTRGEIKNIEQLMLLEEFSERDWKRIKPYLSF